MNDSSQEMNPSETIFGMAKSVFLIMNDLEDEIFLRNDDMVYDFITEVKDIPNGKVIYMIEKLDKDVQKVIKLIQDLIKGLDVIVNKEEITFWNSQMVKLRGEVDCHKRIHVQSWRKDREHIERASQEAVALKRVAGLDIKGFEKVKGYPKESEVSEIKVKDKENLDKMEETEENNLMVEDLDKLDMKLDDNSQVVEKVDDDDTPKVSAKEIDDIPEEEVRLTYALEAAGNDENDLLEDLEATTAEASTSNDPSLPEFESNAMFVNKAQVEHRVENSKNKNGTCVDAIKDLSEDEDKGVDVKGQISNGSDRDSIAKADRETEEQLNHELAPNVLDENRQLLRIFLLFSH